MARTYDAIVVGARCGGAPTAMLLARSGHRVLLVDSATFPSDTLSTHLVHPTGVAALERWGLAGEVADAGTPAITHYSFDFGPFRIAGSPHPTPDGVSTALAPRRVLLDDLLVTAAAQAGAEVRQGFVVEGLLEEGGVVVGVRGRGASGAPVEERARVVIGADGRRSQVATWAGASSYATQPTHAATYFAYWSGVDVEGLNVFVRPARSFGAFPTNDGLTLVVLSWPKAEFAANRRDVEGNFLRSLDLAPELSQRVRAGRRETRFAGTGDVPGFYRTAFGPGWALVGDARHHKDPCTAKGISEAFLDAEALVEALNDGWGGAAGLPERLRAYQQERDARTMPMYEFTTDLARLEPPLPERAELLAAVSRRPETSRDFVSVLAGTRELPDFLSPDNVGRIMAPAMA